jgi:hypothetical protein
MTDKEYYADTEYLTNSMLGWIRVSPLYFIKKFNEIGVVDDDEESFFTFGSAVHAFILENDTFNDRYIISSSKPPSNAVQKKFCDFMIASEKIDDNSMLMAYKMSYKVKDSEKPETVLKKAKALFEENKEYIEVYKNKKDKTLLTQEEFQRIRNIDNNIRASKELTKALYETCRGCAAFNEKAIMYEFEGVKMKSKLDRFVIDFDNKEIHLYDIKTHSVKREDTVFKDSFKKSFEYYDYARQLGLYSFAIDKFIEKEFPSVDFHDFTFTTHIIAIKSNFDNEVRDFIINDDILLSGLFRAKKLVNDYKYYRKEGFDKRIEPVEYLY